MKAFTATDQTFGQFAERFVRNYWTEVSNGSPEFVGHEKPCNQSTDELLSEVEYQTWTQLDEASGTNVFTLVMTNRSGDVWSFTFRASTCGWTLVSASSGNLQNIERVDLLDEVYAYWFQPLFDRVIRNSIEPQGRSFRPRRAHGLLPRELLPPLHNHIGVQRIEFHQVGVASRLLARDQRAAAAAEQVQDVLSLSA